MGAHLSTGRMRTGGAEHAVEELLRFQAPGQHQGLVAIMKMQPIAWKQMAVQNGTGLVARSADLEEGFPAIHQLHLHPIDPA